jgi:hypothetical protein
MFDEVIFLFPLIQLARGGDQIISLVTGALGGCISTLNFFMNHDYKFRHWSCGVLPSFVA